MSSVPGCRADGLVPLAEPGEQSAGDWPSFPDHMRDGLARARFVLRVHEVLLEEAGLVDPD